MFERGHRSARSLEVSLEREIRLYRDYLALLKEERQSITKFNAERVSFLSEKRGHIIDAMNEAHLARLELMKQFQNSEGKRLSEIIKLSFHPEDARRLLRLVGQLKGAVKYVRRSSGEFTSIVRFALGMVDGIRSIIWSATQHVSKSYSRQGEVKERLQPTSSRGSNVLKQA